MHSWNEYYTYLGYTYVLEHDEDGDVRKNIHIVLDTNKKEIDWREVPDWGSYSVPTFEQFAQFVIDYVATHYPWGPGEQQPNTSPEMDEFYMNIERERGNIQQRNASVAEQVDATDLKSVIIIGVWVRVPLLAPNRQSHTGMTLAQQC